MNNSTLNSTTPEVSTISSSHFFAPLRILEFSVLSFGFLFGVPTHSYIIWLIISGTGSGIASGFFNLNLSVCEILNSLNCLLGVLSNWFRIFAMPAEFLQGLGITGRPLFQCLICVERYLAVVHPVTFLKFKPLRYRVICSPPAWIICLGSCLLCKFIRVSINMNAYYWFFTIQFLLFLSVQLFCLSAVLRALKQSGPGERGREREENHMKRRAFYLILISTVNMLIIYLPYVISGFIAGLTEQYISALWLISLFFYVLAGFVQPVLYLQRAGKLFCLFSI